MGLTREDLNRKFDQVPNLTKKFCDDPFVKMLSEGKARAFLRRNPHLRSTSAAVALAMLINEGHNSVRHPEEIEAEKAYFQAARDQYHCDGDLEFDEGHKVSLSDDAGAYVQCWKWISAAEANRCSEPGCHADTEDGEGFDGKCGNCADAKEDVDA